jgi:N-acetylmuramoyl-L-alanine amidase
MYKHSNSALTKAFTALISLFIVSLWLPVIAQGSESQFGGLTLPTTWTPAAERNRGPRLPNVLVLHYTAVPLLEAFEYYQQGHVSAHYTIDRTGNIYQHVDELEVAHHAGMSFWRRASINRDSIGIEIVNAGPVGPCSPRAGDEAATYCSGGVAWQSFPESQIQSIIAAARDILDRYPIDPLDVVGHADIAPQRKEDPGPAFPWLRLAQSGIGVAFDPERGALVHGDEYFMVRDVSYQSLAWAQLQLASVGYAVPQHGQYDAVTSRVLSAFNSHYLGRFDDILDGTSLSVLDGLVRWRRQRMTNELMEEDIQKIAISSDLDFRKWLQTVE